MGNTQISMSEKREHYVDNIDIHRIRFFNGYGETVDLRWRFKVGGVTDSWGWSLRRMSPGETYALVGVENPLPYKWQQVQVEIEVTFPNRTNNGGGGSNGTGLGLNGSITFSILGSQVTMRIVDLVNASSSGTGSLLLRLWAGLDDFSGSSLVGYVMSDKVVDPLRAWQKYSLLEYSTAFSRPPDGLFYPIVTLSEYTSSGWVLRSTRNFSSMVRIGRADGRGRAPTSSEDDSGTVRLLGTVGYELVGGRVILTVDEVQSLRTTGNTGALRIRFWGTRTPYSGGQVAGILLGTVNLPVLHPGQSITNVRRATRFFRPYGVTLYHVMILEEFNGAGWVRRDYRTFSTPQTY
jgi:hypothetical protein